ncbi:MAG: pyridoxamine 5'-phosphate oxidase family protein [Caldilineaceae bacterium]|nr:pyridoxamine 5'-phosphate oxidase family protein [Caldilineaceae bacterium]
MEIPTSDPLLAQLLDKFAAADCCWFASTRADGRAHLAPIWHVWHEGAVYVVTKADAVRARNIERNPHVSLSLPDPMNVFVIEGIAHFAPHMIDELNPVFQQKYAWDITTDPPYNTIIAVNPIKAMAWGGHGEGRWKWER